MAKDYSSSISNYGKSYHNSSHQCDSAKIEPIFSKTKPKPAKGLERISSILNRLIEQGGEA